MELLLQGLESPLVNARDHFDRDPLRSNIYSAPISPDIPGILTENFYKLYGGAHVRQSGGIESWTNHLAGEHT